MNSGFWMTALAAAAGVWIVFSVLFVVCVVGVALAERRAKKDGYSSTKDQARCEARLPERVSQTLDTLASGMTLESAEKLFIKHDLFNYDKVVLGTQIRLWEVARRLRDGAKCEMILREFPRLPPTGLAAVIVYYNANRKEVDALIVKRTEDA